MDGWELSLQGGWIVLEVSDGVRTISKAMTVDEADELAQAITEMVVEADLDVYEDDGADDDEEDEAA